MKTKNAILIDLPKKTDKIYVSVVFAFGLHNESKKTYGLTHLLEHFIVDIIDKETSPIYVNASVGNTYTKFDFDFTKGKAERSLFTVLKIISKPLFNDNELLIKEKARIQNEFYEKYADFKQWLKNEMVRSLIKSPIILKRDYIEQLKNTERATLSSLRLAHRVLYKNSSLVFISGYKISNSQKRKLVNMVKQFFGNTLKAQSRFPETIYWKAKSKTISHEAVSPRYIHHSIIFPAFSLQDSSVPERIALAFICSELKRSFTKSIINMGIYKVDYTYTIAKNYGFVAFFSFIPRKFKNDYQLLLFNDVKKIFSDKEIKSKLQKYIAGKKDYLKKLWNENESRIDWFIDDFIDFGSVKSLSQVRKEFTKVTSEKLREVSKKIFNQSNASTLTVNPRTKINRDDNSDPTSTRRE